MRIAGENEKIPSWEDNWPHCCDFGGDTCDGLRWAAMVLDASKSQQNAPFHRIVWPGQSRRECAASQRMVGPYDKHCRGHSHFSIIA